MSANDILAWHDFFVMAGGGAAALTGLLFVALSVNLRHIIGTRGVTSRAATLLIGLVTILFTSALALIPDQSPLAFGVEIFIVGFIGITFDQIFRRRFHIPVEFMSRRRHAFLRLVLLVGSTIPAWISGASLIMGWPHALDWLAASFAFLLFGGISGSWVLLIELPLWVARQEGRQE